MQRERREKTNLETKLVRSAIDAYNEIPSFAIRAFTPERHQQDARCTRKTKITPVVAPQGLDGRSCRGRRRLSHDFQNITRYNSARTRQPRMGRAAGAGLGHMNHPGPDPDRFRLRLFMV